MPRCANRYQIDAKTPLDLHVRCSDAAADDFRTLTPFIASLAGVGRLECGPNTAKPRGGDARPPGI